MLKFWNKKQGESVLICAPLAGEVVPMAEVNDPTFSADILGKGVAIRPARGRVVAPADGTVTQMFDTGHAVSFTTDEGVELLVHVGLDTVQLKGAHYTIRSPGGSRVRAGEVLMEFDLDAIAGAGFDTVTPVVVLEAERYAAVEVMASGPVDELDALIRIQKQPAP